MNALKEKRTEAGNVREYVHNLFYPGYYLSTFILTNAWLKYIDSTKGESNRMDSINVEEFKRNIKGCLDQLPFIVTRRGKPLFVCVKPENAPCPTMPEPEIVSVGAPCEAVPVPDVPIKDDPIHTEPCEPLHPAREQVAYVNPDTHTHKPVIRSVDDVKRIVDSLPMRAYFRPCTKASQTHSAGKAKGKS